MMVAKRAWQAMRVAARLLGLIGLPAVGQASNVRYRCADGTMLLVHDAFSSNRAEGINVIVFNQMEHDVAQKPVPTFWHHALAHFQPGRVDLRIGGGVMSLPQAISADGRRYRGDDVTFRIKGQGAELTRGAVQTHCLAYP